MKMDCSGEKYEVFLSFRGKDTRKTFTDFLYHNLDDAGIRTFRDDDELRVGEEIGPALLKAIKESKISIPIFSRDYASSKWCLRELAQMVECHKTMQQKILPIFYDVEPSDVRHQTGSYEEAFRQHQKHFDEEIVQGWKEALREVAQMKGWELKKETNGHQGELVKRVSSNVLLELKKYMVVTENLVGIDHHEEKMMGLLNVGFNDVCIVGIHGMGGLGKTTIAKVIYNKLSVSGCFECCCFLADVRETSQQNLLNLQKQLISTIRKQKSCDDITNVDEGINTIKDIIGRKKFLIVLDDVDKKSQFHKIVGKRDWFGSGSRIIVTTRNKHVLNQLEVDKIYEPPLMEPGHSLQLFSKHAFRTESPPEDYDILSKSVVSMAAGLPLAIEVIGSSLVAKSKAVWKDTLMKLKKIPNNDVQETLRISYKALDEYQQLIFLDIACFFIGVDKRLPFYMWDEFSPTNAVDVLQLWSLVKIGDDNIIRMHDQLRDLGRQIVREENSRQPGERSRLFIHEEALDVLVNGMGTRNVEALKLEFSKEESGKPHRFTAEEFKELRNLRYLRVDYADLDGDFTGLFSKLRWLRWHECPRNFTPTNLHLKKLVILDLSNNENLKDDWEGWIQIKMVENLKVLILSRCNGLTRTPNFSTFTSLEILNLGKCENLVEIHPSIWKLKNLKMLDISREGQIRTHPANTITKFPDEIGNLEKLEEINASNCRDLQGEIPSSIGRLSSLRILSLNHTKICSLPMSICGLSRLKTLDLFKCNNLQSLPDELPSSLTSLCVTCISKEFPSCLSNLINLKELFFDFCVNLVEIPGDIGKLSKLKTLVLANCDKLVEIPKDIGKLSELETLSLTSCDKLVEIPRDIGKLSKLRSLRLINCYELVEIPRDIGKLSELETLLLCRCNKISILPAEIGALSRLKQLELYSCQNLQCILALPSSLFKLCLDRCRSVESLPDLSNLKNLSELRLNYFSKLMEIQGLEKLQHLMSLDLSWCESLERLPDVSNLGMLKELKLRNCEKLAKVEGLGVLKSLERLDVSWCTSLQLDLSNLTNLKVLEICGLKNFTEIRGFEELEYLEYLDMASCEFEKTRDLSNLKSLKELKVNFCEKLTEIQGLEELKSLMLLDISECKSIVSLPDLSNTQIVGFHQMHFIGSNN